MEDMPPKTLKSQLVHLDHNLKEIERNRFAGIQRAPGSLPVLEAFQEFLDKERAKAQKKMLFLTSAFVILFLLVTAGGATFIYLQMKKSAVDYQDLTQSTQALKAQLATTSETTQKSIDNLVSRLEKSTVAQQGLSVTSSNITQRVELTKKDIEAIKKTIAALESENSALKAALEQVADNWKTTTLKLKTIENQQKEMIASATKHPPRQEASQKLTPAPSLVKQAPTTKQSARVSENLPVQSATTKKVAITEKPVSANPNRSPAKVLKDSSTLSMTITPAGSKHGIRWRLPILSLE